MGYVGRRFIAIDGHEASFIHEKSPQFKVFGLKYSVFSYQNRLAPALVPGEKGNGLEGITGTVTTVYPGVGRI
jgi:hypothetical protein